MTTQPEPRFYVRKLTGVPIGRVGKRSGSAPVTTYYVMDRLYNCRVVETFENPLTSRSGKEYDTDHYWLHRMAQRRCDQLNEWWDLELKYG